MVDVIVGTEERRAAEGGGVGTDDGVDEGRVIMFGIPVVRGGADEVAVGSGWVG